MVDSTRMYAQTKGRVSDPLFKIEIIYDYEADTTELVIPDKLRLLPKINLLAFLKDTADLVQAEHSKVLEEYNKEGKNAT